MISFFKNRYFEIVLDLQKSWKIVESSICLSHNLHCILHNRGTIMKTNKLSFKHSTKLENKENFDFTVFFTLIFFLFSCIQSRISHHVS